MSAPTHNRFVEVKAISLIEAKLAALSQAVTAPTAKVYARQRAVRQALWQEMAGVCAEQANALSEAPAVKRRVPKAPPTPAPTNISLVAAEQEKAS